MVARALLPVCLTALLLAPAAAAEEALPGGRAIVATTSLSPDTHLFADPVVARVDLVVDPRQFDPARIRARLRFAPYETVGPIRETRRAEGDLVHIRYTATLRCLHVACIAPRAETILGEQESGRAERHSFDFPPAEVSYEGADGPRVLLRRRFPPVEVVSRVNTAQLEETDQPALPGSPLPNAYVASIEPPPPTYRASPTLLAAAALAGAFLLFLFPAVLAGRFVYGRWRAARRPRPLSPIERALALVEWTTARDDGEEDRRQALEVLAVVLERGGAQPLAETTRALAWAPESPARDRADALAAEARHTFAGGGNGRPA